MHSEQGREPVTLVLPVPPAANRYWRQGGGRIYKSQEARDYQTRVEEKLLAAKLTMFRQPVAVDVLWFRGRRSGDLDGRLKVILDALQGTVYENDSQIRKLSAELIDVGHQSGLARMQVTISPYQERAP